MHCYLLVVSEMFDYFAERDRGSVDSGSDESSQDGLAECVVSSSRQELEELHQVFIVRRRDNHLL